MGEQRVAGFVDVDWTNDDQVAGFVSVVLDDKHELNQEIERQSEMNSAWYRGLQQLFWSNRSRRLVTQPNPNGRVRLVHNEMLGLIDGYAAKLSEDNISLGCERATDDITDYMKCYVQSRVLAAYQKLLGFETLIDENDLQTVCSGEGFIKVVWDSEKGALAAPEDLELSPADMDMSPEEFEKALPEIAELRIGDLCVKSIDTFNIFWGPEGTTFDEADYVIEVYEKSKAHVMDRYGLTADEVNEGGDANRHRVRNAGYARRQEYGNVTGERVNNENVVVAELWVAAKKNIPGLERGRHVIWINGKVPENDSIPYDHGQIPIVYWQLQYVPGCYRGHTPVTDLIPPQRNINSAVSQFAENRERMANPVWVVAQSSIVDESEWVAVVGGVRQYRGEKPPALEQGAAMPNSVLMMIDKDKKAMENIMAMRDVSNAKNPAGARSGSMLSLLKEGDDQRLNRVAKRRRTAYKKVGELMLSTLAQYATERRIIHVAGDDSEPITVAFSGGNIESPDGNYNVVLNTRGSHRSMSARQSAVETAAQAGFLNPQDPRDRSLVLESLELGETPHNVDVTHGERLNQRRRNIRMLQEDSFFEPPDLYENPNVLREELNAFRRHAFFKSADQDTKNKFDQYETLVIQLTLLKKQRIEQALQPLLVEQTPQNPEVPGNPQNSVDNN